jgi:Methyltransferase domain
LLNWAARYFPIIRCLRSIEREGCTVLEIGSGSHGLVYLYHKPVVSCDVRFPAHPASPMIPVIASATLLPLRDGSFDAVVASDMLEHVASASRAIVISEALRVARRMAIFGFPSGALAHSLDEKLFADLTKAGTQPPDWLLEHMESAFPDGSLFAGLPAGWVVKNFGNEQIGFHDWMMRKEMNPVWNRFFRLAVRFFAPVVERLLRLADREPYYRMVYVVSRTARGMKNGNARV